MSLVEKELTRQNVERANNSPELASSREKEMTLTPTNAEQARFLFEHNALPIEQIYIGFPNEEFSLRVRCTYKLEGNEYTGTIKDEGVVAEGARDRFEKETPISKEAYELYVLMSRSDFFTERKLRAEIQQGLTIDFVEGIETPIVEVEHDDPEKRYQLINDLQTALGGELIDRTGDTSLDNHEIAFALSGVERKEPTESLDAFTKRVISEMVAQYVTGKKQVVVGLDGMSGSGKTTVTKAVQEKIVELYGDKFKPAVISTDDYHFGKTKLEEIYGAPYTEWDDAKTYNTKGLAFDLTQLAEGVPIIKRHFDFDSEEPILDEELPLTPFVIIEGLYAGSKDLEKVRDIHFELPTSIATSVGRDVRRLIIEDRKNRVFPTAESRLRYQLEVAIPKYLEREKPSRNSFSASSRPMAARAFMLAKLNAE